MALREAVADLGQEVTRLHLALQRFSREIQAALAPEETAAPPPLAPEVSPIFPGPGREAGGVVFVSQANLQVGAGRTILIPDFLAPISGTGQILVSGETEVAMDLLVDGVARAVNQGYPIPAGQWFAFDFPMVRNVPYNIRFDRVARVSVYGLLVVR